MTHRSIHTFSLFLAAAILAAILAAPAGAAITYLSTFPDTAGGAGSGRGQLGNANGNGIAVNTATGEVYVTDLANNRIQQYDASGTFIRMWGAGVNQTSGGNLCPRLGNPGDVCKAGNPSAAAGGFNGPTGIAVDNSGGPAAGSVYVEDSGNLRVQRFSGDGSFLLTWGKGVNQTSAGDICPSAGNPADVCGPGLSSTDAGSFQTFRYGNAIATDGDGLVYVLSAAPLGEGPGLGYAGVKRIQQFEHTGAFLGQHARRTLEEGGIIDGGSIAANATGRVFLADEGFGFGGDEHIKVFGPEDFSATGLSGGWDLKFSDGDRASGVAIDPANQFVFFANNSNHGPCKTATVEQGTHFTEWHPSGEELVDCTPSSAPGIEKTSTSGIAVSLDHKLYAVLGTRIRTFAAPVSSPPLLGAAPVAKATTDSALIKAQVAGRLSDTVTHLEFGTDGPCSANPCDSTADVNSGATVGFRTIDLPLADLVPDTTYQYRVVAENAEGSPVAGPDLSFRTYAAPLFHECANNLARQQTGAAFLADCRAYELVSAPDAGGYDVESDVIAGQTPFAGYPEASARALYALDSGVVPGVAGNPTNRGPDPYLAVRDAETKTWKTSYVGIPSDAPSTKPFSSTLAGADPALGAFAFSGPEMCDPCFADGSSGIPLRTDDGQLVQGMTGSLPVADPVPAGGVRKHFSGDGRYFLFASEQKFEPAANPGDGNVTVYRRDLETGQTRVVSTLPGGPAIAAGAEVRALDISADGSRVLIGRRLSTDSAGNERYHLYMHLDSSPQSIDLTPATANGVLYGGMTADGSVVYFTGADQLTGDDTDGSADLFRAELDGSSADITRVSLAAGALPGGVGDTDACTPDVNSVNPHWNAVTGSGPDCSVVALGGGAGVASESGAVYFLSPEQLDGTEGEDDAPNLYLAEPGSAPRFLATLESVRTGPQPPATFHKLRKTFGTFSKAQGLAYDEANGAVYVLDFSANVVKKFDAEGNPVNFTEGGNAGTNQLTGVGTPAGSFNFNGVFGFVPVMHPAVDPSTGDLYVPTFVPGGFGTVPRVYIFASSGLFKGEFTPGGTGLNAIAVNPVTHNVYVSEPFNARVRVYTPAGALLQTIAVTAQGIGVDSAQNLYAATSTQTAKYNSAGTLVGIIHPKASAGVAVNPIDDHVFVNEGNRILEFDSSGAPYGQPSGSGEISSSIGIAAAGDDVYATLGTNVGILGLAYTPSPVIDSPLVIHSVNAATQRHTADFQTTPSGEFAAFLSVLSLGGNGYDSAGRYEVFRYDAQAELVECASCTPTMVPPAGDAALAAQGLSIADDGRLFFNTTEPLVLRDINGKRDAYQYSDGRTELISTGTSSTESSLLGVTRDGVDAFFFTREVLAADDRNGKHVKLYDARVGGGAFTVPPAPGCAASDECHGPGSPSPPVLSAPTVAGRGGNFPPQPRCKKPKVRRGDRCVRRKGSRKRGGKRAGRMGAHRRAGADRGGSK